MLILKCDACDSEIEFGGSGESSDNDENYIYDGDDYTIHSLGNYLLGCENWQGDCDTDKMHCAYHLKNENAAIMTHEEIERWRQKQAQEILSLGCHLCRPCLNKANKAEKDASKKSGEEARRAILVRIKKGEKIPDPFDDEKERRKEQDEISKIFGE